jgi:hypothetical protein
MQPLLAKNSALWRLGLTLCETPTFIQLHPTGEAYFFRFEVTDSDQISVTHYIDVKHDIDCNCPTTTVLYSGETADGSQ